MKVYLAGPIKDCTKEEAWRWRYRLQELRPDIEWLMPPDLNERFHKGLLTEKDKVKLVEDDKAMIERSDAIIANVWKDSVGTAMEVIYACENCVPVVMLNERGRHLSPWWTEHADDLIEGEAAYPTDDQMDALYIEVINTLLANWHPHSHPVTGRRYPKRAM
jgi:nucleoside 2-deoxyribosyltransferase